MKNLAEEARAILQEYVDKQHNGVRSRAATALGIANMTLKQWLDGTRIPNLENLSPAFEKLGISFSKPAVHEFARDVCWVNARIMPAGEHVAPPVAEDYLAAPLVGEVGAGPGYLPQDEVQSWFLVYKHIPAIMGRRNLIAVEIGKTSTSMLPLLSPGDIVLVDRDDIDVSHAGHIMLVRDPEGAGMVKRVSVQPTPGSRDFSIQFYSDNAATNPPLLYSLREDYGGEISNAIVGRVIWAWSDVRGK